MNTFAIRFAGLLAGLFVAQPSLAQSAPFNVDLNRFTYSYGTVVHSLDFSVVSGFGPNVQDPASGWYLSWDALETTGSSGVVNGAYRLSLPQATALSPDQHSLSSINGTSGFPPVGYAPSEWKVVGQFSNMTNATTPDRFYDIRIGGGTYVPNGVNLNEEAEWFTGDRFGIHYDHVLRIGSSLSLAGYSWHNDSPNVLITGLDPQHTFLEMMVDITNGGQTYSSYYRLNNEADWHLAHTHTLPAGVGVLAGFAESHPYVATEVGVLTIPEPGTAWLFSAGVMLLHGLFRRTRRVA
jgi:hypothetical protein